MTAQKPLKYALVMQDSSLSVFSKRYDVYDYLSIINNTDNTIQAFAGKIVEGDEKNTVVTILPYTSLTVPIGSNPDYTFIYTDGGAAGVKKADIIFSVENMGYSSTLGPTINGSLSILSEPATAADAAAGLPSVLKVVAGYDGTNVQAIKTSAAGNLQTDVASLPALAAGSAHIGEVAVNTLPNVTLNGFSFANDAANHTVNALKGAAGVLHGVNVNTVGTTSTITIYDGLTTGGTKIATIDTSVLGFHQFDAIFATGLTYVTAGGAAADITLMYR